MTKLLKAFLSW